MAQFFILPKKRSAFTLAELLTAVLIISVIMVALAPVITKRMKDNVSVTTDNKKGLEIFANPGTYTFDVPIGINTLFLQGAGGGGGGAGASLSGEINVTKTSNSTWTVPKGVNQVTLKITGAGGGGGGANGTLTGKECKSYDWDRWNSGLFVKRIPEYNIVRGADDGGDLCMFTQSTHAGYPNWIGAKDYVSGDENLCTSDYCCWRTNNDAKKGVAVCTYPAAASMCEYYPNPQSMDINGTPNPERNTYRLPKQKELQYIADNVANLYIPLNICGNNQTTYCPGSPKTYPTDRTCDGTAANGISSGQLHGMWGQDKIAYRTCTFTCNNGVLFNQLNTAFQVRCVRPLKHVSAFSGAGGSSGAVLEKTINVLPNDTFEITIGQGGAGGASKTKGSQGGTTKIVHKRGGIELGTYYVKGGLGGNAASTSAHGTAYTNGTNANNTTPSGTCYARARKNVTDSLTGGNTNCTTISYTGAAGNGTKGGDGGKVGNVGTINQGEASSGGYLYDDPARGFGVRNTAKEANYAKGQNASTAGFGGGGGLTPAWANSTSHFYQGGKGANGKVEILYKMALPGSGGGSASRVGGVEESTNKDYEIKYKVSEGDRIVIEVGSGGSGGAPGQDGLSGTPTIVGDNEIIFLAGEGGKAVTQNQKDSIRSCVQNASSNSQIASCLNNSSYKPQGGRSGIITVDNEIKTTTLGLLITNTNNTSYTVPSSTFKGKDGNMPSQINQNIIPWSYGYDGGVGGAPFGIRKSNAAASITCGGGMSGTYGDTTDIENYVCTSGNINANNARNHDPANNEFGGSGGGGGGVTNDSFEQGQGGNGSSGYLRIRWDASEQE